jgi:hypothetical protein
MSKTIVIKLTESSLRSGPFNITDQFGNVIAIGVSRNELIAGIAYSVADDVTLITIESFGKCKNKRTFAIGTIIPSELAAATYTPSNNACLWTHLKNPVLYNTFYGNIEPYIIEYPFSYQFNDEILQNVKDYTKAYKYLPDTDFVSDECDKIETNDRWFNKAVLYNGQQSTGILELVPKPLHNLNAYLKYPIYNAESKTITFTKSDNFYQYNTFWSVIKDRQEPLFLRSCESLSIDKIVNQANMNYGTMSFRKDPLRAKDLKVRHILDNRSDAHLVSQFITTPAQISYK